jgi:threonine dehydrogenase-like Zn-dependent dehydrogenase
MNALIYHGPNDKGGDEVPEPTLVDNADAFVRIDAATIGRDLHVLKGNLPKVPAGRILGHEAVGTVEEVGAVPGVESLKALQSVASSRHHQRIPSGVDPSDATSLLSSSVVDHQERAWA